LPRKIKDISGRIVKGWIVTPENERRLQKGGVQFATYFKLECQECRAFRWLSAKSIKKQNLRPCKCQTPAQTSQATAEPKKPKASKFQFPETEAREKVILWKSLRHTDKRKADQIFEDILSLCDPMIMTLLNAKQLGKYMEIGEAMQLVHIKLFRYILPGYKPETGSRLYSWLTACIGNKVKDLQAETASRPIMESIDGMEEGEISAGLLELNKIAIESYHDNHDADEISAAIGMMETPLRDARELEAQRWLIGNLIEVQDEMSRKKLSVAASRVFGLSEDRCRAILSLSLVELRRRLSELISERGGVPLKGERLFHFKIPKKASQVALELDGMQKRPLFA
jgi:hypothetical protein